MGKAIAIIVALALVAGGGYLLIRGETDTTSDTTPTTLTDTPTNTAGDESMMEDSGDATNVYTLADVSEHSTEDDCWLVIESTVYDVTSYIADDTHPGGDAILEGCGIDATELFNTRPMGSGTPHSEKARSFLPNFEIGALAQ